MSELKFAGVYWFTGLSGAGKTTIAEAVRLKLEKQWYSVLILDGDVVRRQFHTHLGFSELDITENNRLISELCETNRHEYDVILVPIISPFESSRILAKKRLGDGFYVVHVHANLETLQYRDTKGLYKLAKEGVIDNLIGVSDGSRYDFPLNPDLNIDTEDLSKEESICVLCSFIEGNTNRKYQSSNDSYSKN